MYINNVLYCFYSSDTEALEACFRLLHDDDDDDDDTSYSQEKHRWSHFKFTLYHALSKLLTKCISHIVHRVAIRPTFTRVFIKLQLVIKQCHQS